MMLGQNLTDLEQHRREFVAGEAFRVQVLDDSLPATLTRPALRLHSVNATDSATLTHGHFRCRLLRLIRTPVDSCQPTRSGDHRDTWRRSRSVLVGVAPPAVTTGPGVQFVRTGSHLGITGLLKRCSHAQTIARPRCDPVRGTGRSRITAIERPRLRLAARSRSSGSSCLSGWTKPAMMTRSPSA